MKTSKYFFISIVLFTLTSLLVISIPQSYSQQQFSLKSSAFSHNAAIPRKYTCQGKNVSTPLEWHGVPAKTKSFALIMEDPDAQRVVGYTWVHWIVYNIPSKITKLPEGLLPAAKITLREGTTATHGITSWKKPGYGGPCPPAGTGVHHYQYKLLALSIEPTLPRGLSKAKLLEAIKRSIIAETHLTGIYERK